MKTVLQCGGWDYKMTRIKPTNEDYRTLTLPKNGHTYIFRYAAGREADMIKHLANLASRFEETGFDWFDAAVLSYKIGREVEKELI